VIYDILLPVSPVPAARPKLARRGRRVYYPKTYSDFRKQAKEVVPGAMMASGIGGPLKGPLLVAVAIVAKRPKTTKLDYPSPDVDNYGPDGH
jgi:Holliday junction resolvase RusA-like endonuclease